MQIEMAIPNAPYKCAKLKANMMFSKAMNINTNACNLTLFVAIIVVAAISCGR